MTTRTLCDKCGAEISRAKGNQVVEGVNPSGDTAGEAKPLQERLQQPGPNPPKLDRKFALVGVGPFPPDGDVCAHCALEALTAKLGPRT